MSNGVTMVRGYHPPPKEAAMDYAGYGTPSRYRYAAIVGGDRNAPRPYAGYGCGSCGSNRAMSHFASAPIAPWAWNPDTQTIRTEYVTQTQPTAPAPTSIPMGKVALAAVAVLGAFWLMR